MKRPVMWGIAASLVVGSSGGPASAKSDASAVLAGFEPTAEGKPDGAVVAALAGAKIIAKECSEASHTAFALHADVVAETPGEETVAVSLLHGVVAFDSSGKVVAQSVDPISGCGGSGARVVSVWAGQLVPDAEAEIVLVISDKQERTAWKELVVAKRQKSTFRLILTHLLAEKEGGKVKNYPISLGQDGTVVAGGDGSGTSRLRWQAGSFAFEDPHDSNLEGAPAASVALGTTPGASPDSATAPRARIQERYNAARTRMRKDRKLKSLSSKAEHLIKLSCKTADSARVMRENLERCGDGGCRDSQIARYTRKADQLQQRAEKQTTELGPLREKAAALGGDAAELFVEFQRAALACFCPDEELNTKAVCR
jgi:hypothetical protein